MSSNPNDEILTDKIKRLAESIKAAETAVLLSHADETGRILSACRNAIDEFATYSERLAGTPADYKKLVQRIDDLRTSVTCETNGAIDCWIRKNHAELGTLCASIHRVL